MSRADAEKVADVLVTVDGYCSHCAVAAAVAMAERFPEHPWTDMVRARLNASWSE
jgi:hypothetical protein